PENSDVRIDLPCGWGSTLPPPDGEPDPQVTSLCQIIKLFATDRCDLDLHYIRRNLDIYDTTTSSFLPPIQSPDCITATPGFLDDRIGKLIYVLYWSARDHWGNESVPWQTVFQIIPDPPTPECGAPRHAQILSSGVAP